MEFAPSMRGDHGMQHMKPIGTPGHGSMGRPNHHGSGHGSTTMLADAGYGPPAGNLTIYFSFWQDIGIAIHTHR